MTKVLKVYLICNTVDKDGNAVDYTDVNRILWDLQKETRIIKNKAVQLCWEWFNFRSDYKEKYGDYPTAKDILNYTIDGYIYDRLKTDNYIHTSNLTTTLNDVIKQFKINLINYVNGLKSIANYKSNQPLDVHSNCIDLVQQDNKFMINIALLNKAGNQCYNINRFIFIPLIKDKSTQCIIERCFCGIYKISASKLIYEHAKKMWRLNLCYTFTTIATKQSNTDTDVILGVDLGIVNPIVASVYGNKTRFIIHGNEILSFQRKIEQRKIALQKQMRYCGMGRIGHGKSTRLTPIIGIEHKIAHFRNTTNFKYAKALVEYAIKQHCTIIQLEDLSNIAETNSFLKNWSYYDLQTKIINKATEHGIIVNKIDPKYTSQRCSCCGFISNANRISQDKFKCLQCGFAENADYNASQNIAIKNIDKIIETALKK